MIQLRSVSFVFLGYMPTSSCSVCLEMRHGGGGLVLACSARDTCGIAHPAGIVPGCSHEQWQAFKCLLQTLISLSLLPQLSMDFVCASEQSDMLEPRCLLLSLLSTVASYMGL